MASVENFVALRDKIGWYYRFFSWDISERSSAEEKVGRDRFYLKSYGVEFTI